MAPVFLGLLVLQPLAAETAPEKTACIAVFSEKGAQVDAGTLFSVRIAESEQPIVISSRASPPRSILLVVDPAPEARTEIRRRVVAVAKALASVPGTAQPALRIGIPIAAGVLTPPLNDRKTIAAEIERLFADYLGEPNRLVFPLPRTLDLAAELIQKAEADAGPLDSLLLFRDHEFQGAEGAYLNSGTERLLSSIGSRKGSVIHGYLDGAGILWNSSLRSGGLTFGWNETPEVVARGIAEAARNTLLLHVELGIRSRAGPLPVEVRAATGTPLRALRTLWLHPDGGVPPNHYAMQQGLDWLRRARDAEETGNMTQALRFITVAMREDSWNPETYALGGRVARASGDAGLAAGYLGKAFRLGASDERTVREFSAVSRQLGQAASALEELEILFKGGLIPTQAVKLELARLQSAAGRGETARALYAEFVEKNPENDAAIAEYADLLRRLGEEAGAQAQFKAALARNPANILALLYMSETAASAGRHDQAAEFARAAAAADPRNPDVHVRLGKIAEARRDWPAATQSYRAALDLAPERKDYRDRLVDAFARAGRSGDGIEMLRRWLETDASDLTAYQKLGELLARNGNFGEAASTLESGASRVSGETYRLYLEAAQLRERRSEYGQALLDYRAMLRLAPSGTAEELRNRLSTHIAALSLLVESRAEPGPLPLEDELNVTRSPPAKPRQAPREKSPAQADSGILIPGGLDLLARSTGIDASLLRKPDALERLFSFILEGSPQQSKGPMDNPVSRDILEYLRTYDALRDHMRKRGLLTKDFDASPDHEFLFPLAGDTEALKKTRDFLSFFGVALRVRKSPAKSLAIDLILNRSRSGALRQQFLRNLGVNLLERNQRQIRVKLGRGSIPVVLGSQTWSDKILPPGGKRASRYLLERLVASKPAMRLYVALARCADSAREGIVRAFAPGDLLLHSEIVFKFGRFLEFNNGDPVLPGDQRAWESLLGVTYQSSPRAFLSALLGRDQGRPMLLYYALATAPRPVRDYLATQGRLERLYQALAETSRAKSAASEPLAGMMELGRMLRHFSADGNGLLLDLDDRLKRHLGGKWVAESQGAPERARLSDESQLPQFLAKSGMVPLQRLSAIGLIELIRYLKASHPEILSPETLDTLIQDPVQTPVMLDLVLDLSPPPALLARYFEFARNLFAGRDQGWKGNRTRTAQALFHLLALLRRQGALSADEGCRILSAALERFAAQDEAEFAQRTAQLLSDELLPAITRCCPAPPGSDAILKALAGTDRPLDFEFDGRRIRLDVAGHKLERMKRTIEHQNYTSLASVLEAYRLLRESAFWETTSGLEAVRQAISTIGITDPGPASSSTLKQAIAQADMASIISKLTAAVNGRSRASASRLRAEVASALHVELGVSLLAYCYAYHGAPEIDALAFDPNLVRKHAFFWRNQGSEGCWSPAHVGGTDASGLHLTGSVSGLGFELGRLEMSQTSQNFGRREGRMLVPTILSGMRVVKRWQRSDRAQDYVALSVHLARELLAVSAFDERFYRWCGEFLQSRIAPGRREQVLRLIQEGDPLGAARILSPSELFFMGQDYRRAVEMSRELTSIPAPGFQSPSASAAEALNRPATGEGKQGVPQLAGPLLERLRQVMPPESNTTVHAFRREVDQYGALLRRRLGLSHLSLAIVDSFEQLETDVPEEILFERICDLKIRIAELNYALGLPAFVGEVEIELAIRDILPKTDMVQTDSWQLALEQIARLEPESARQWIEELLNRGVLTPSSDSETNGGSTSP